MGWQEWSSIMGRDRRRERDSLAEYLYLIRASKRTGSSLPMNLFFIPLDPRMSCSI
jgi:hypothetical protein